MAIGVLAPTSVHKEHVPILMATHVLLAAQENSTLDQVARIGKLLEKHAKQKEWILRLYTAKKKMLLF